MLDGDIDKLAESLYREAGFSGEEQAPLVALATRLLGEGSVRLVPASALPGDGALARVGERWRIYLRRDACQLAKRFVLLHELAHWALGKSGSETECDELAAALLVPRCAFLVALKPSTHSFSALARRFGATETCVALRLGEVTNRPIALVAPATVRVRGAIYSWPSEARIRELAALPKPGLRKTVLRDGPRRVVLLP